ncbi:hypothetical protein BX54_26790 [Escherichia coli O121:H19 str. 2010C-3840]|nr:hypothetical protein EC50959_2836 [Escherichia coli 5.0959]ETI76711.1 hypothetical protein Q460_13200 [Escherichia coli ATCC BAA-2219]EYV03282.1 hypothetical protein BX54_26790 [Escherichia coli O121:H19 str. 2010C-3840]EYV04816.1 hypothetical protein BX52_26055 [Escherichia coli O121:H19 str. 2010C-3609]EYV70650.1 hypothetical protein BX32_01805 [Escherichia coli O121:H19 str. 2009EL1412]EYV71366.1 hypothetical protein BX25_01785 [Escherichia coli O121:H19 str. 2009C-4659]EYX92062.1 hypot
MSGCSKEALHLTAVSSFVAVSARLGWPHWGGKNLCAFLVYGQKMSVIKTPVNRSQRTVTLFRYIDFRDALMAEVF